MNKVLLRVFTKKQKEYDNLLKLLNGNGKKKLSGEGLNNSEDLVSYLSAEGLAETGGNSIGGLINNIKQALRVVETTDGKCPLCIQPISPKALKSNVPTCFNHAKERVTQKKSVEEFLGELLEGIS